MQVDKTTLTDLAIFHNEEEQSVFHLLNFTNTIGGKECLQYLFAHPYSDIKDIQQTQQILQLICKHESQWPTIITNGTIMVVEKLFLTPLEQIPTQPNHLAAAYYKIINAADYSLLKYSVNHFSDFIKGLQLILLMFDHDHVPPLLKSLLYRLQKLITRPQIKLLAERNRSEELSTIDYLKIGGFLQSNFKPETLELIDIFSKMDAYYSMAIACKKYQCCFPTFENTALPFIEATDVYHPLLPIPVAYNVLLNEQQNFLFLTGANMAGKSTFIKAVGLSVYLAHLGMGVPAKTCRLSLFDGLLSNIQVEDNISRGESYFYNEVQRIKKTIDKINDGRKWLILIDELFKGTNVQDAMKCSTVVIEGLRKMNNALFILSTHLYEIGEGLKQYPNIRFCYFETHVQDGQLVFSYQLKVGISNDRLGYLILKREGVVDLLEKL